MNFRVFLLIGAMGVFGALWSSDGRYQANQIAMVRAERARSANATAVFVAKIQSEMNGLRGQFAVKVADAARAVTPDTATVAPTQPVPIVRKTDEAITPNVLLGRLVVAWFLNVDPGDGVRLFSNQAALAKAPFEEHFCLLRFRTRGAAFYASRRIAALLRAQWSASQPSRLARILIREVPEESQAPAAGGQVR